MLCAQGLSAGFGQTPNTDYLGFLWGWTQNEPHLGKFQFLLGSGITISCSVVAQERGLGGALSPPLSFSLLPPGVGVGTASARTGCGVTCIPLVMPLQISALVPLQQEEKGLTLKTSSLLSPARYFSTYFSGFLSI